MKIPNFLLFLLAFLKNPKRVGSIFPSSAFLARKIVQSVYWNDVRAIAELGALKKEYPHFKLASNASSLVKKMNQEQIQQLDCIICGLPFF